MEQNTFEKNGDMDLIQETLEQWKSEITNLISANDKDRKSQLEKHKKEINHKIENIINKSIEDKNIVDRIQQRLIKKTNIIWIILCLTVGISVFSISAFLINTIL